MGAWIARREDPKDATQVAGREEMLRRIRKALGRPAEAPTARPRGLEHPPDALAGVLPALAPEELLPKFETELVKVGGATYRVATQQALADVLLKILGSSDAPRVVLSGNPLLKLLRLQEMLQERVYSVEVWPEATAAPSPENPATRWQEFTAASFAATVGITGADFALAESGSLVVTSATEGSQLASLAPPVHIALYRRNQLVGSLDEVLERLPVPRNPDEPIPGRSVVFVTGTSRTADIEQILIRGVHGPREVHAILVEESCLE